MVKAAKNFTTRERILATALQLFNENGERNVTTATIAKNLGISEGNLWYHFRTKRDLVFALFGQLETAVDENLSRLPQANAELKDHLRYAARAFEYLWEYRFLFRDRFENLEGEDFNRRVQEMTVRGQKNVERILRDMRDCGMLVITPEDAHALAINAWIVHSNWVGFLQARDQISEITEAHIKEGFAQMMALFNPYWAEEARREASQLLSDFVPVKN